MFCVTAWAPPTRPQALGTGWLDPSDHRLSPISTLEPRIHPNSQDRASAERFKSNTAIDPEHLPSYRRSRECLVRKPILPTRLSTRGKQYRVPVRSTLTPRPLVKECLGSHRARPQFARAFRRRATMTKDTSDRRLQSHISKTSTLVSRGYRPASPELPPVRANGERGSRRIAPLRSAALSLRTGRFRSRCDV